LIKYNKMRSFFLTLYIGLITCSSLTLSPSWAQQNSGPLPPGLIREGSGLQLQPADRLPPSAQLSEDIASNQPAAQVQSFDDWVYRCSDVKMGEENVTQCELLQVRQVKQGEEMVNILILALAEIAPEKEGGAPAILLTTVVPLDVFLPEGMRFLVDGREVIHIPYQNCNSQGCWSRAILEDKVISALKKGNNGLARFAVVNGQGAEIQFSLKGFTAGMDTLQKRKK